MESPIDAEDIINIQNLINVIELVQDTTRNFIMSHPNCVHHLSDLETLETKKIQTLALKSLATLKFEDSLLPITPRTIRLKLMEIENEINLFTRLN